MEYIENIKFQSLRFKAKSTKIQFFKYCKICEEDKQYISEIRDIRKTHSKNIRALENFIAMEYWIII